MITLIYGDNNYQARTELSCIIADFETEEGIERYSAEELTSAELPNVLSGLNLFSPKRLVIIAGAGQNKDLWAAIGQHSDIVSSDVHLVLSEETVDKRTKTFKDLLKTADVIETKELTELVALKWLSNEAKERGIGLTAQNAQSLVSRVGLNQWQLHFALEKLTGLDEIEENVIQDIVEATPQASAFALIDAALARQPEKIQANLAILRVSEDAYFFFGLLASQIFQLIALACTKKSPNDIAKDLGVHPYPLQKMQGLAARLQPKDVKSISETIAGCDNQLKRSGIEPWEIIEVTLLKLAALKK